MNDNGGLRTEARQVLYEVLSTQIQFGAFRYQDVLPSMVEAGKSFLVSVDTVRPAYQRLREEGYLSISTNVGAKVQVRYSEAEIQRFIEVFFIERKAALMDLSKSMKPLFENAQWNGLRHADPETLRRIEEVSRSSLRAPYAALQHLSYKYAALGNDLLMRLAWKVFMFFQAPFFSLTENLRYLEPVMDYVPSILRYCRGEDWAALRLHVDDFQDRLSYALEQFYASRIPARAPEQEIRFEWNPYKKPSQLCYSLARELLVDICRGIYPPGSRLPAQKELAEMKNVSIITVRRTLDVLCGMGVLQSAQGARVLVLPFADSAENCDFTKPAVRRRLMDFIQSMQILALSCRAVSALTLNALDAQGMARWRAQWNALRSEALETSLIYSIFELFAQLAPYEAVRTIYAELIKQLWWGHPLRAVFSDRETVSRFYAGYYEALTACLDQGDTARFSAKLEELMLLQVRFGVENLARMGVEEVRGILIPPLSVSSDLL